MASSPFQHNTAPGPPSPARPVEWGPAVHGSSAFLQAVNQGYPPATCPAPTPACNGDAWQMGNNHHAAAFPSSSQPSGATHGAYGYAEHYHAWAAVQQPYPGFYPPPDSHPRQYSAWQHQHQPVQPPLYPTYDTHTHPYQYQPNQQPQCLISHQTQQPYPQQHQQQYAWQSYHCHSAVQDAGAAADGSDAGSDWKGWASHSGAREPPVQSSADAPDPLPNNGNSAAGTGVGACTSTSAACQEKEACGGVAVAAGTGVAGAAGAQSSHRAAAEEQLYDPMSDAETPAEPVAAAATTVPSALTPAPPAGTASGVEPGGHGGATLRIAEPVAAPPTQAAALMSTTSTAVDLIVVWDLDETLIVFNSLLSGAFARAAAAAAAGAGPADGAPAAAAAAAVIGTVAVASSTALTPADGADARTVPLLDQAAVLGRRLADIVFSFCDNHMAFKKFDEMDPTSFAELWAAAATAAAAPAAAVAPESVAAAAVDRATLERIAEVYGGGAAGLADVFGDAACRTLASALAEAEHLTGGWVAAARRLLAGVTKEAQATAAAAACSQRGQEQRPVLAFRQVRHVLVSAGHLVATLGKLLLWGLDEHFDIRDVYSASGRPKMEVFRSLRARFGPTAAYAAVGDGREEERAAAVMGWGFVRVGLAESGAAAGGAGPGAAEPWRSARPLGAIRPEDVMAAARAAY